ncbi:MAG: pilus assembly FimT family protein [Bdellovibrionota bacterium]|jgi:prepilin-type N-terminal cleavage/methylation domain-containing protein
MKYSCNEKGFSLVEVLAVLGLISALFSMAVFDFRHLDDAGRNGAKELSSFLKEVRARAMSLTLAYTIEPISPTEVIALSSNNCTSTDLTEDPELKLVLPKGAYLVTTDWSICYGTRGIADTSLDIELSSNRNSHRSETVQVVLGGGVRIKPQNNGG